MDGTDRFHGRFSSEVIYLNIVFVSIMKKIIKTFAVNIFVFSLLLLIAEIFLRFYISYNPSYYTSIAKSGRCYEYIYGTICYNSMGFPDNEFDLDSEKDKIGYFGDSICAGLGAGQGYRISDLMESHFNEFEHWNFCRYGNLGLTRREISRILENVDYYGLNKVVYIMNLNDIAPSAADHKDKFAGDNVLNIKRSVRFLKIDWLRGKSYLYTHARNIVKTYLTVKGYLHSGYKSIELFPRENIGAMREFSDKLLDVGKVLKESSVEFIVVVLPYEMQISNDAAEKYKDLGIKWEDGFLLGSTQKFFMEELGDSANLKIYNAYDAFEGLKAREKVGEYFVFNKGDRIDWNHPNRNGHKVISDYLIKTVL